MEAIQYISVVIFITVFASLIFRIYECIRLSKNKMKPSLLLALMFRHPLIFKTIKRSLEMDDKKHNDTLKLPYIEILYARKLANILVVSCFALSFLLYAFISRISITSGLWIFILCYLLVILIYQFTISYRYKHGYFGFNRFEAKDLIELIISDRSGGMPSGGRPIYGTKDADEVIEKVRGREVVPDVRT